MSEFRQNYATKEWVIIAPERNLRPHDFVQAAAAASRPRRHEPGCPFCPGNESLTGIETWADRDARANWRVRVVRNKFAPLDPSRSTHRSQVGRFLKADSYGDAEVVIESPFHDATPEEMSPEELMRILLAYRIRAAAISSLSSIAIVTIFRNHGARAGTSLVHPHSQIIATPIVPPHIRDPFQLAAMHYDDNGTCVYCDMVAEELRLGDRIVYENAGFVVFCPYASRTPYELRIYPRRHAAGFTWISDAELPLFADALGVTLRKIDAVLDNPSYNYIIRSAPVGDEDVRYLHWYFVLVPRVSTPAGFEIGSGIYINPAAPERCAEELRSAVP